MSLTRKILATLALIIGVTGAAAGPALADNQMPVSPHDGVVAPLDNNMP